jgi:hypothetical protein
MKFIDSRPFTDPDAAARRLIEIANSIEPVQDGRIHIEKINLPFLRGGGSPVEYGAGLKRAIELGWLWIHESGTYVKFTPAGADFSPQRWTRAMCNLYSITTNQAAIIALFRVMNRHVGNPPPMPGVSSTGCAKRRC